MEKVMATTVPDYIATFPAEVQVVLERLRTLVLDAAPTATESVSYGMPAYKLHGKPLVYFAAFRRHIGVYATPSAHGAFAAALAPYKQGKGSVQFPLKKPLPYDLVAEMVRFRAGALAKALGK